MTTVWQGPWLNYFCCSPGPGGGACPAMAVTQVAACPPVPSFEQATCTLNLPPPPLAHRRRPYPTAGRVLVLPGSWQPVTDAYDDIVVDGLGTMCPAGTGYIRIPCAGYYWIEARAIFEPLVGGVVHGVGVTCNGVIQQKGYAPAPLPGSSISLDISAHITQRYAAGDQIALMAWTEQAGGTLSGSFDLYVEWKHA
ncbi:hypothetical protein BH10CHL1_BH10CHL1_06540 [soil metagenome]